MSIHGVDVIRCGEVCGVVVVMEKVISGWRGGEGGEAMLAVVGKVVRMAWLLLWRRWLVVGVVEKVVRMAWFVEMRVWRRWLALWRRWLWWLVQNNDSNRKTLPQRSQPCYTNNSL